MLLLSGGGIPKASLGLTRYSPVEVPLCWLWWSRSLYSNWPLIFPPPQSNPCLMAATSPTILPTTSRTTLQQWLTTTTKEWTTVRRRTRRKSRIHITVVTPLNTTHNSLRTLGMVTAQAPPTLKTWSWGHRGSPGGFHGTLSSWRRARREDFKGRMDSPEVLELCTSQHTHKFTHANMSDNWYAHTHTAHLKLWWDSALPLSPVGFPTRWKQCKYLCGLLYDISVKGRSEKCLIYVSIVQW